MRGFRELAARGEGALGSVARVCVASTLLLATIARAEPARIDDLLVEREENQLLVSFELINAFDADFLERVTSGLPTGFRYQIKLERLRRYWLNPSLHKSELEVIAMYNAITREYLVNYKQDGRLIDSRTVKSPEELSQAMTLLHALPFFVVERPREGRLVVRVRAELGPKTILLLIPTTRQTPWAASETFSGLEPPAAPIQGVRPAANPDTRP